VLRENLTWIVLSCDPISSAS